MRYQAGSLIQNAISSFSASESSPHEQLSRMDFVARLAFALSAHSAIHNSDLSIGISATPGLGDLRQGLEAIAEKCGKPVFSAIAQAGLQMLKVRLKTSDPALSTVEKLRNHLFHGGSLPAGIDSARLAGELSAAIALANNKIISQLGTAAIESVPSARGPKQAILKWNTESIQLFPLLAFSSDSNALLVFSRLTSSELTYKAARHEQGQRLRRLEVDNAFFLRIFRQERADSYLADLEQRILDDIQGFLESGTAPAHQIDNGVLHVRWSYADGGGTRERHDRLRVWEDNQWQWEDDELGSWRGYSDFLRALAKWPVLKQRLAIGFEELVEQAKRQDEQLLPLPEGVRRPENLPCVFSVGRMDGQPEVLTLEQFTDRLSTDVRTARDLTRLYFLHAEAGAGKTTTLLHIAWERAKSPELTLPLFLYISARGNVLESLDQAIDAAVAKTRLIERDSAKALCRNGLLIPIVDGFDELVGSPTYDDALASLRPWLKELGGRGVLLVSARSNYFLNHYKDSFHRQTNQDINVDHRIAELSAWDWESLDKYLSQCGVPRSRVTELPPEEQELLRIPFFARASLKHLRLPRKTNSEGLLAELIRDYAAREQQKLNLQGSGLISAPALEELFTALAEWMLKNNTREMPLADLKFAAQVVLPNGEQPELQNRLPALCAVDIRHSGMDRYFRFSHEVFFDFFVGRYVAGLVGRPIELKQLLTRFKLTQTAARVVWSIAPPKETLLATLVNGITTPLPDNAGLLWGRLFATRQNLTGIEIRRAHFGDVDLRNSRIGVLTFIDCTFASLILPSRPPSALSFTGGSIEHLEIASNCQGLSFVNCSIGVVTKGQHYFDDDAPEDIVKLLRECGANVISSFAERTGAGSDMPRLSQFFLEHMKARVASSIVLNENHLPENDLSLSWIVRNAAKWLRFRQALMQYELAYEELMDAGGSRKFRFRLALPPDSILDSNRGGEVVKQFWAALNRGDFG